MTDAGTLRIGLAESDHSPTGVDARPGPERIEAAAAIRWRKGSRAQEPNSRAWPPFGKGTRIFRGPVAQIPRGLAHAADLV